MKKFISLFTTTFLFSGAIVSVAYAQSAYNPNDSSFPESNQLNPTPREPDRAYGSSSSTHRLPAGDEVRAEKPKVKHHSKGNKPDIAPAQHLESK